MVMIVVIVLGILAGGFAYSMKVETKLARKSLSHPALQCPLRGYSASAASRTASACPGTLTFSHTLAIRPSGPIRNVVRRIPMNLRP